MALIGTPGRAGSPQLIGGGIVVPVSSPAQIILPGPQIVLVPTNQATGPTIEMLLVGG